MLFLLYEKSYELLDAGRLQDVRLKLKGGNNYEKDQLSLSLMQKLKILLWNGRGK